MSSKKEELEAKKAELKKNEEQRSSKQHDRGKLTARERINILFDENSFVEVGRFIESQSTNFGMEEKKVEGDGVITGYGTIDGRLVFSYAQDFTVLGGSLGEMHAQKITKIMKRAMKVGAPLIALNDSGGARIQEGVDALKGYGDIFFLNTRASGVIPQISVIMGPCAGGAVYSPAITDFVFMVDQTSKMFITGPQVIETVTGESITAEELGGAFAHNERSGVAHFMSSDEEECFQQIRTLLSFIPDNREEVPPAVEAVDSSKMESSEVGNLVPESGNKAYDIRKVIEEIIDDYFFEVHQYYAQNIVVGFARLDGQSIGIIASQPQVLAGCLDINASDKAARFIRFCDSFNIPLLSLVDVPGYLPGIDQEQGGIIRHGAKLLYAYAEATVPKLTVILRKAYGGAYIAMCSSHLGADTVFAWPRAEIAVMGPEGAAKVIFRREIKASDNPEETKAERIEQYRENFANPYRAASRGYIDDVIEPENTRPLLINALYAALNKREELPDKKHGNIPL